MSDVDQAAKATAPTLWDRSNDKKGRRNGLILTTALLAPVLLDGPSDRYAKAFEMLQMTTDTWSSSVLATGVAASFLAVNIVQAIGVGMWLNAGVSYLKGEIPKVSKDSSAVALKAPAGLMEQSLKMAHEVTKDHVNQDVMAELEAMIDRCERINVSSKGSGSVYLVHDPASPAKVLELKSEKEFLEFKRMMDATDKPLTRMTWEKKGDVEIQTMQTTVGGKLDSSRIGNVPAVKKFEWKEGDYLGTLKSQGWFLDRKEVRPIELVASDAMKKAIAKGEGDLSQGMGELPESAVIRKENFAFATGVLLAKTPEDSPVHEAGLTHRVWVGEQQGGMVEIGFATDAEVAALKKALEPTGIFLNEEGKPTMQRGKPLSEDREATFGLGLG